MAMQAVILAGGLGKRLSPFTQVIPKPLLPIGESSVLEIQILSLRKHGIREIFIATNYMSEYVEAFLGDGSKYGVKLHFSREEKPLGTVGPLSLLRDRLKEPFLLMNGDILTTLNYEKVTRFAAGLPDANLIVCTKEMTTPFQFGKVTSEGDYLTDIEEKPSFKLEILAGIYLLRPAIMDLIPKDTYYGMDSLIKYLLHKKMRIGKYLMTDYWLDIGQINDFETAQEAYKEHFVDLRAN